MEIDESRWKCLKGGHGLPFDPRQAVVQVADERTRPQAWDELWEKLHHQGDVGEASYAAIPMLVAAAQRGLGNDWNLYALVASIELARTESKNPPLPSWIEKEYFSSIRQLAELGASELSKSKNNETTRAILAILALAKELRTYAWFILNYSEDELAELETK